MTSQTTSKTQDLSLPLATVLSLLGTDPPLNQRQAMRFLQVGIVAGTPTGRGYAARRAYAYRDILAFEIGRVLVCNLGVPTSTAAEILGELRRTGYFLQEQEIKEIDRLKKEIDHPAEFRELVNERYGVSLPVYSSPDHLVANEDGTTTRIPRSKENHKKTIRSLAFKLTKVSRHGARPWPICVLIRQTSNEWRTAIEELPAALRSGRPAADAADEASGRAVLELAAKMCRYPGTQVLNLYLLESQLRTRVAVWQGVDPGETGEDDDEIKLW